MVFSERSLAAFNEQIGREIAASYNYLSMSEYFDALGLDGFSTWFEAQSAEEWMHAMKFRAYVQDRGGKVKYGPVRDPRSEFDSAKEVFEIALEQEQSNSASIADLYALAVEEKDFASQALLNWFVTEQVEEEKTVQDIIEWLKRIGDSQEGLYLLDEKFTNGGFRAAPGGGGADTGGA